MKENRSAEILNRFINFTAANNFIAQGEKVMCALSGGADSVVLLHLLKHLSRKIKFDLTAAHVNHMIRGAEAGRDEKFAASFCQSLGINFISEKINVPAIAAKNKANLEQTAREERYKFLTRASIKFKCSKAALGHHLDDNAETVFLNLLRGTNPKGLAGIPLTRQLKGGKKPITIIRPLLCLSREEILLYAKTNGLEFVTDSTNNCQDYTRNWVRSTLIPLLEEKQPQIKQHVLTLAANTEKLINAAKKTQKTADGPLPLISIKQ